MTGPDLLIAISFVVTNKKEGIMSTHSRFVFLSVVLLFVLLASLGYPTAAYADDSTPPPPATEEVVLPSTPEEPSLPPTAEPTKEAGVEPAATETVTVSDVLEATPEGTEVVVLDENREILPLVSVEAAELVIASDPMWCPTGIAPIANTGGCTNSYSTLEDLLTNA